MRLGVDDIASICEYIAVLGDDGVWRYTDPPNDLSQPVWSEIPDLEPEDANLRFAGRIPILDSATDTWVSGGLLNHVSEGEDAVAVYRDPTTNEITTKRWSERYPEVDSEDNPEPDSMPKANVAATWGDYFLLGDITWKADPSEPFSDSNAARYPHGIWFSEPGSSDTWDPINVVFVGQKLTDNAILGMFPLEAGLVIISQSSVSILRGAPNDFVFDEMRSNVSPESRYEVAYWPHAGVVCWLDRRGRVWVTNGNTIERLDRDVDIERVGPGAVIAVDENLFVSGRADVRVLRSFGEGASWTRMITPTGWKQAASCRGIVVGVGADQGGGTFILDSEEFGVLDVDTLVGEPDYLQAYSLFDEDNRGLFDGVPVNPVIRTRPLPGASDRTIFWHRFGVRANGPGALRAARAYPSAKVEDTPWEVLVDQTLDDNKLHTFPAHGPSVEAMFEFEFEGDVTPEHLTVSFHAGRAER